MLAADSAPPPTNSIFPLWPGLKFGKEAVLWPRTTPEGDRLSNSIAIVWGCPPIVFPPLNFIIPEYPHASFFQSLNEKQPVRSSVYGAAYLTEMEKGGDDEWNLSLPINNANMITPTTSAIKLPALGRPVNFGIAQAEMSAARAQKRAIVPTSGITKPVPISTHNGVERRRRRMLPPMILSVLVLLERPFVVPPGVVVWSLVLRLLPHVKQTTHLLGLIL